MDVVRAPLTEGNNMIGSELDVRLLPIAAQAAELIPGFQVPPLLGRIRALRGVLTRSALVVRGDPPIRVRRAPSYTASLVALLVGGVPAGVSLLHPFSRRPAPTGYLFPLSLGVPGAIKNVALTLAIATLVVQPVLPHSAVAEVRARLVEVATRTNLLFKRQGKLDGLHSIAHLMAVDKAQGLAFHIAKLSVVLRGEPRPLAASTMAETVWDFCRRSVRLIMHVEPPIRYAAPRTVRAVAGICCA